MYFFVHLPAVRKVDTLSQTTEFLPRDASAERGYEIACRLSVRLSVTQYMLSCSGPANVIDFSTNRKAYATSY